MVASDIHISSVVTSSENATVVNRPSPGLIVAAETEKPRTVVPLTVIIYPASSLEPPDAPVIVKPVNSNCMPPTTSELTMYKSSVPALVLTF